MSIFRENWAHSLRLLKEFRGTAEAGFPLRKKSLRKAFLKYETSSFSVTPFYKVRSITGDDIVWEACQLLFAFVGAAYDFFENDLRLALEEYSKDSNQISSHEKLYDEYTKEVHRLNKEADKFYLILKELQNIVLYVETRPIGFRGLERLKDLPEIKQSIVSLRKVFADTNSLSENKNQTKGGEFPHLLSVRTSDHRDTGR